MLDIISSHYPITGEGATGPGGAPVYKATHTWGHPSCNPLVDGSKPMSQLEFRVPRVDLECQSFDENSQINLCKSISSLDTSSLLSWPRACSWAV